MAKNTLILLAILTTFLSPLATTKPLSVTAEENIVSDASNTLPIAAWAFTDSQIVSGTINIGIVTYHLLGIKEVSFTVGDNTYQVTKESINPDTREYEYVLPLNTTTLKNLTTYDVHATVTPNLAKTTYALPPLRIQINQSPNVKTLYVNNLLGNDKTGNGSEQRPFATAGRALGFTFAYQGNADIAMAGDTVQLADTGIVYDFPEGRYGRLTGYVTLRGGDNIQMYGGTLRSNFLKLSHIALVYGGNHGGISTDNASHIWLDSCSYTGIGQIYAQYNNTDVAILSKGSSRHVTVENCVISQAAQGIMLIGGGRYLVRNNRVHSQRADAYKIMLGNRRTNLSNHDVSSLFTNNQAYNIGRPNGWAVAKATAPYEFGAASTLTLHRSVNKGETYAVAASIILSGSITSKQLVKILNANHDFQQYWIASLSQAPYPNIGAIKIELRHNNENHWFYTTGSAASILNFGNNTLAANDLSPAYPAKTSDEHGDYLANDNGDLSQFILRNSRFYGIKQGQGIKFDVINPSGQKPPQQGTKQNIAIINNVISSPSHTAARMLYLDYTGSGSPPSHINYNNLLILHNTFHKPETGNVRSTVTIERDMPTQYLRNVFIINNIIGDYHKGDFVNLGYPGITSSNNLMGASRFGGGALARGSALGKPAFTDPANGNYTITRQSPAVDMGIDVNIHYDQKFNPRLGKVDVGAYELGSRQ